MITKATVGTSAAQASAARERSILILENQGSVAIYFSLEGTSAVTVPAGASPGLTLEAGEKFTATSEGPWRNILGNAIHAISGTAGQILVIHEC